MAWRYTFTKKHLRPTPEVVPEIGFKLAADALTLYSLFHVDILHLDIILILGKHETRSVTLHAIPPAVYIMSGMLAFLNAALLFLEQLRLGLKIVKKKNSPFSPLCFGVRS